MENIKKIKKSALVLLVVVGLIMLYHIILVVSSTVANGFVFFPAPDGRSFNPVKNVLYIMGTLILLSIQICALILLLSIKRDETPFKIKNVKLLKNIAIMLMTLEPLEVIAAGIPVAMDDGTFIFMRFFPSGNLFVAGIVVYCVSLVFKYGISLQQQSDETL